MTVKLSSTPNLLNNKMKPDGFLAWVCIRHYGQRGQSKILVRDVHRCLAGGIGPTAKANTRLAARWVRHTGQRTQQAQAWLRHKSNQMSGAQQRRTPTAWLPSPVRQIDRWEVICKQVVHGSKRLVQVSVPGRRHGKCHTGYQGPVGGWVQGQCPIPKGDRAFGQEN